MTGESFEAFSDRDQKERPNLILEGYEPNAVILDLLKRPEHGALAAMVTPQVPVALGPGMETNPFLESNG